MKKTDNRQAGFGPVIVLVVVLVVVVIGAAGWVVYQHHHKASDKSNAATTTTQATSQQQTATSTQPAPVAYLNIKEWGVKLPLSSAISDAYYTMQGSNVGTDGLPNTAWLGLTSLNSSGCDVAAAGPSAHATPVGSIVRVLPTDLEPVKGKPYSQLYPGVTIGGYFYGYIASATKTSCASATTLQGVDAAFTAAIKAGASASATN